MECLFFVRKVAPQNRALWGVANNNSSGKTRVRRAIVFDQLAFEQGKKKLRRDALQTNEPRDLAFKRMILAIPSGKVSTYGAVAAAAGYPRYHRAVARLLRTMPVDHLPWHRVVGAGGQIKLPGDGAREQRKRLKLEGVEFVGKRIDMQRFEHVLRTWEIYR